jgi:hypothetical protein
MAKTSEKGSAMPTGNLDYLQQLLELNRAFVGLLQARVLGERHSFGLPAAARAALRLASQPLVDAVAGFPRALFRLELVPSSRALRGDPGACHDEAEHDLTLSILHAVRHASRHSSYQARLLFGLTAPEVACLSALSLSDLQRLACVPGVLQCSFRDRPWFWQGLLTATRPELRRQLTLMALQPGISVEWPQRRPPHASG